MVKKKQAVIDQYELQRQVAFLAKNGNLPASLVVLPKKSTSEVMTTSKSPSQSLEVYHVRFDHLKMADIRIEVGNDSLNSLIRA